jgi:hypothetical protein
MLPPFTAEGVLPSGIHAAAWPEVVARFGQTPRRRELLTGLLRALEDLRAAGCRRVYLNGSFVTAKEEPGDYDLCWDPDGVDRKTLPQMIRDPEPWEPQMRQHHGGDIFREGDRVGFGGWTFLDMFQFDRGKGRMKGIILLEMETLP